MNEVLYNKIKYLLEFKNTSEENSKYTNLLEKIFYELIISLEENYNTDNTKNSYYSFLLNKLNNNIKSIIISNNFSYNESGFLELNKNLKSLLNPYIEQNITITNPLKENILKKNYFYYLLLALKNTSKLTYFDRYMNEEQAVKLINYIKKVIL